MCRLVFVQKKSRVRIRLLDDRRPHGSVDDGEWPLWSKASDA